MKFLAMAGAGAIAAVTAVVVTGPEVRRYPITPTEALERLATTPLPEPLLDMSGRQVSLVREGGALSWHLGDADHRSIGRVTLEADGAATNVTINFQLADNALGHSPVSKTRLTRSMAESIFAEHVDSALARRPFDVRRMMNGTAREIEADPEMLQAFGEAIDDQFNGVATMLNDGNQVEILPTGQSSAVPRPARGEGSTR